ncbi:MAG TPA: amylo-alpha-1,6-glucosidase [Kofleriaceae bacterium]|nr:amylo-alpha-1,6-glucosidase [Kofleriaceae bacterium]
MSDGDPIRRVALAGDDARQRQEWLVCNGLGGYASGTLDGIPTRRYHGLLVAALPNPAGRVMMLSSLATQLRLHDGRIDLGWVPGMLSAGRALHLVDVTYELGLPVWRYEGNGVAIERRIVLTYGQNTAVIQFRMLDGRARIELRPAVQFRGHDEPVSSALPAAYPLTALGAQIELLAPPPLPSLRLQLAGERTSFVLEPRTVADIAYTTEESRGYASRGALFSPGRFRAELEPGQSVALFASTESWDTITTLGAADVLAAERERRRGLIDAAIPIARTGPAAELVLAADAFVVEPAGRRADHVRARAAGDEVWTVIAGYPWFTDWGRDTMISLEGLCLVTGRIAQAGAILKMFARHVRDGLVPNMFPEGSSEGLYHTADATLWYFHAVDRYLRASGDRRTLVQLLPILCDSIERHIEGTDFGIHVDRGDGLLVQGAAGYQLTWMDAKAGDWVVTPRRGKAVEINALWYNALSLASRWIAEVGNPSYARHLDELAQRAQGAFNRRFWNERTGCLYDVVDGERGDDPAIRPNQLFAISLPHAVLDPARWRPVLATVERELLTPVGLRSLSPADPDYKSIYRGDLLARDAAYHQGTVWSWLIGPYIDAVLRVRPEDRAAARGALAGLIDRLGTNCIGQVSEVFDGQPPFAPGGCVAQAWGVAELLRCLVVTA